MARKPLFGLFGNPVFKDTKDEIPEEQKTTFVPSHNIEGATIIETGTPGTMGAVSTFVDFEGSFKTERELIVKYRDVVMQPEADDAVSNIVNEAIVIEENRPSVEVVLDSTSFSDGIKKKIGDEFNNVLALLNFSEEGHDIFRQWYVDGRMYYHVVKNIKNPKAGIYELRRISPLHIKKVVEVEKEQKNVNGQPVDVIKSVNEYFVFLDDKLYRAGQGIKIHPDEICYVHSGILDKSHNFILSHVHKAIKPVNQLRMIEDAVIIYRLARAPERRVFYIDIGTLPKQKAEQTIQSLMGKYRNKVTYDAVSGEVVSSTNQMSMMEDFWLPRREGGKGTQVETLQGGQNLGEIQDVEYFQQRMYKSLNVPVSRLDQDNAFGIGRSSEITRDEIKFAKFVARLRKRFSHLFLELLETQLMLKNIVTQEEWDRERYNIRFDFIEDNHFAELKNSEIMAERLNRLSAIDNYVGRYYSIDWVRKNVLMQTEEEIAELDKEMDKEREEGLYDERRDINAYLGDDPNADPEDPTPTTNSSSNPKAKDDQSLQHTIDIRVKKAT